MVWVKKVGMKPCYVCDECGFGYSDAKTALECEGFCRKNHSCDPSIVKRAIYQP
jgi:hypothetical protein